MSQFTLIVRVLNPLAIPFKEFIESVLAQTNPDWELLLVANQKNEDTWRQVSRLALLHPRIKYIHKLDEVLLASVANEFITDLGTYVTFLHQHDRLTPNALSQIQLTFDQHPIAQVVYSNEGYRDYLDKQSFRYVKGEINQIQLVSQEYLGDLTFISCAYLSAIRGFDLMASTCPNHWLYLQVSRNLGSEGFAYVPEVLCEHYRDYMQNVTTITGSSYLPVKDKFDPYAVKKHLESVGVSANVDSGHHIIRIYPKYLNNKTVSIVLVLNDDLENMNDRIHALYARTSSVYTNITYLYMGDSEESALIYSQLATNDKAKFQRGYSNVPASLNRLDLGSQYLLVLDSEMEYSNLVDTLLAYTSYPNTAAVVPKTLRHSYMTMPGTLGYRYEGHHWNSSGQRHKLAVAHQLSAAGSSCLLIDVDKLKQVGGFNAALPNLWAMDLTMRLDLAGHKIIYVPNVSVRVAHVEPSFEPERILLTSYWEDWTDRFNTHDLT